MSSNWGNDPISYSLSMGVLMSTGIEPKAALDSRKLIKVRIRFRTIEWNDFMAVHRRACYNHLKKWFSFTLTEIEQL